MNKYSNITCIYRLKLLCLLLLVGSSLANAANVGTVVPIVGQVFDLAYDSQRNLVYLANATENAVNVYSVGSGGVIATIQTGTSPVSLAISPDNSKLYVANNGSNTISVIDLDAQQKINDLAVGSRPDAVAVGYDGLVLILGPAGLIRLDPSSGQLIPLAISVPPTPAGISPITPTAVPTGFLAGMTTSVAGNIIVGLSTNRLFVYDVASGTVVASRNVTGIRAILSISPDGSRFMAGPFLFDTQTLAILGRAGTVAAALSGGSAFSIDGNTVYGTFSTQNPINPLNTNNPQNPGGAVLPGTGGAVPGVKTQGVLQVMRASSLTPLLGLRLAEAINPKIVASTDGQFLFAISTSGMLVIPIGRLNQFPILGVDQPNVLLSVNICNRTIVSARIQIQNLGSGRMTFSSALNNTAGPVTITGGAGLAPSSLTVTFNPRSVTTRGTQQFAVVLISPEAVNIEPVILVNVNFRDTPQVGTTIPINGVAVDQVLDQARGLVYVANYTMDQVEVYSIANQTFLPPIRVGNRPLSLAMVNSSTLVVANSGAEYISVIDLNQLQVVSGITMGPIPLNATPLFPRSIAASNNAVLFTAIPLAATAGAAPPNTGSMWQLSLATNSAFPRLNLGSGNTNVLQGVTRLVAPANGSSIVSFENNGRLRLYDPIGDTFPVTRTGAVTGFRGTAAAAADGSYYVLDDFVFNSVLGFTGNLTPTASGAGGGGGAAGAAAASQLLTFGVAAAGSNVVRVNAPNNTVLVQSLQVTNPNNFQPFQAYQLPEAVMDISPTAQNTTAAVTRLWPPNVVAREIGVNGQQQLLRSQVLIDSNNTAYALTVSGLSVVGLVATQGRVPSFRANGVVNSADYSANLSPGMLISIFGSNLADNGSASNLPLPTSMGGVCVTANEVAIPLLYTSPTQINAQLPPALAAGNITLAVRSTALGIASPGIPIRLTATAPSVFTVPFESKNWTQLFHSEDFSLVTPSNPGKRDKVLVLYTSGLGSVQPAVPAGAAGGGSPASTTTQTVEVSIGGHPYPVLFSGLAPGLVGVYQVNIYVPGDRVQGDDLPVVVDVGSLRAFTSGDPLTAIH